MSHTFAGWLGRFGMQVYFTGYVPETPPPTFCRTCHETPTFTLPSIGRTAQSCGKMHGYREGWRIGVNNLIYLLTFSDDHCGQVMVWDGWTYCVPFKHNINPSLILKGMLFKLWYKWREIKMTVLPLYSGDLLRFCPIFLTWYAFICTLNHWYEFV